ncbi:MAG: 3-deoxy-D-manno-octulosonic acid kinase [Granulosicoccus sp.]
MRSGSTRTEQIWRYRTDLPDLVFDQQFFDEDWLYANNAVHQKANAGRGVTLFVSLNGYSLVLRRYRRGGLVSRLSKRRYLWSGLEHSRPMREFDTLFRLETLQLPASRAYAVELRRVAGGLAYEASLLTLRLDGSTLAELLSRDSVPESTWSVIGHCIATFHLARLQHADLNAHNIMVEAGKAYLIDFDRSRWRSDKHDRSWMEKNLMRLHRSLSKVAGENGAWQSGWLQLKSSYADTLAEKSMIV